MNLGSYDIDDVVTFTANTQNVATGAAVDADSVPTYRVYEDETTTPILTGSMALIDSSNTVGFYSEQITLSAANGFERGKCYTVYITGTVNSITGTTSRQLQVGAKVDVRAWLGTTPATPTVAGVPEVDLTHMGGDAQSGTDLKDFADAGYDPATNKVQGVVLADAVTTLNGIAANVITAASIATDAIDGDAIAASAVTEIQSGLATPTNITAATGIVLSGVTHTGAVIPTITTLTGHTPQTGDSFSRIGAAGAGLTNIDLPNQTMDIVGTITTVTNLTNAPSDSSGVTTLLTRLPAGLFTGLTNFAQWLGLLGGKQVGNTTARTELNATGAGAGTYDETTDSTQAIRDAGTTTADIADAVLDEVVLGSYTLRQLIRGIAASTIGKLSGAATTTVTIRSADDTKNVVVATVDADGNRSAVTLDLT